jgi:hypothetical protein
MLQKAFDNESKGRTQTYVLGKQIKTVEIQFKILHVLDDNPQH